MAERKPISLNAQMALIASRERITRDQLESLQAQNTIYMNQRESARQTLMYVKECLLNQWPVTAMVAIDQEMETWK